ncbi:hypothetical protein BJV78DRAFT_1126964 [Lactifluus subvellereus]|nr:hypothetical protein BJV78DRAFT_1126964 [Lactifluus subvellereus]
MQELPCLHSRSHGSNPSGRSKIKPPRNRRTLTPSRKARNREAQKAGGEIRFDLSISCKSQNNLAEFFIFFTNPDKISTIPARRPYTQGINHRHQGITVYKDGACINNGKLNSGCGSGIWISPNHKRNAAIHIQGP